MQGFKNINGNWIHETSIISDCVTMGTGNFIGAYTVIGSNGEIRGTIQSEYKGTVFIGDNNVISEHVTIQRPYKETSTFVGNNNIIMAHSHLGHDSFIGNNTEICSGSIIGGYAKILNGVKIKLKCVIRNRVTVCENSIVGMGSVVTKDVEHSKVVYGNPAKEKTK